MDLTQVTKLIEAGFTAQEIREMMQGTQPEPQPDQTEQRLTNIENNISSLLKAIQESNVRKDTLLGGNTKSMQELTNDAMNALINPTKEEHK